MWNVESGRISLFYGSFLVSSVIIISCLEDGKSDTPEKLNRLFHVVSMNQNLHLPSFLSSTLFPQTSFSF